ncbi:hypothetical protein L1765_12255 [Microaerobacter geothermalis]|uniref:hypothetical protein n=1 Tax=Microaerobacter geothermalis TaxID=674972 RepID=UPI001F225A6F|nr:hypothetical protein [Microaerobacter geothermalis]MCF6094733.1 hypothetical protein [Microaerobacter geothermalis]
MPLKIAERKKLNIFLRDFFANNRIASFFDIVECLQKEYPRLFTKLTESSYKLTIEAYLAQYFLPKYMKEGWLQIDGDNYKVQLSPNRCSYCFKSIDDIYIIDIDLNRYCGWRCAEKCRYYCDPYESHLDTYQELFDRFSTWLPQTRKYSNFIKMKNTDNISCLVKEIERYVNDVHFDEFRWPLEEQSCIESEIYRMLQVLDREVERLNKFIE